MKIYAVTGLSDICKYVILICGQNIFFKGDFDMLTTMGMSNKDYIYRTGISSSKFYEDKANGLVPYAGGKYFTYFDVEGRLLSGRVKKQTDLLPKMTTHRYDRLSMDLSVPSPKDIIESLYELYYHEYEAVINFSDFLLEYMITLMKDMVIYVYDNRVSNNVSVKKLEYISDNTSEKINELITKYGHDDDLIHWDKLITVMNHQSKIDKEDVRQVISVDLIAVLKVFRGCDDAVKSRYLLFINELMRDILDMLKDIIVPALEITYIKDKYLFERWREFFELLVVSIGYRHLFEV